MVDIIVLNVGFTQYRLTHQSSPVIIIFIGGMLTILNWVVCGIVLPTLFKFTPLTPTPKNGVPMMLMIGMHPVASTGHVKLEHHSPNLCLQCVLGRLAAIQQNQLQHINFNKFQGA